jgi:transcription termination factor NusB
MAALEDAVAGQRAGAADADMLLRLANLEVAVANGTAASGSVSDELEARLVDIQRQQVEGRQMEAGIMNQMAALEEAINEVNMAEVLNERLDMMEEAIVQISMRAVQVRGHTHQHPQCVPNVP